MKKYLIEGSVMITYIRPATDTDKAREAPVKTDAVLERDAVLDYTFNESDILPDEVLVMKAPDGTDIPMPPCYTLYDIKRPMGWFWVAKSAVKEIE